MKVLLLGSGGREHALAAGLARTADVFALPGNPGIGRIAALVDGDPNDPAGVIEASRREAIDLVVVGPEAPLVGGVADALREAGIAVFGPDAEAARIEGSKTHAKHMMDHAGIPTARWDAFHTVEGAIAFLDELGATYVVKADGLAAGKGVTVTEDREAAIDAVRESIVGGRFGDAGLRVVIEEFLDGPEASLIGFSDGSLVVACEPAQDYKRVGDQDRGPNTGGMGAYSPVPACPPALADALAVEILEPMVHETGRIGSPFVGALYAGLALTSKGPRVVEFNARFGDPETQALIPRLRTDLAQVCLAAATGDLRGVALEWDERPCVTVVLASEGYPASPRTGAVIEGVEDAEGMDDVHVFHAGTAEKDGRLIASGGRVLAVSALGDTFKDARARAYAAVDRISFDGMHHRTDIAKRVEHVVKGDR